MVLQDLESFEKTQQTLALLKLLALGQQQIETGQVVEVSTAIERIRARRTDPEWAVRDAVRDIEETDEYLTTGDSAEKADYVLDRIEAVLQRLSKSPERSNRPRKLLAPGPGDYRQIFSKLIESSIRFAQGYLRLADCRWPQRHGDLVTEPTIGSLAVNLLLTSATLAE